MNESDLSLPTTNTVQPALSLRRIVRHIDRKKKQYMLVILLGWIAIMLLSGGETFRGDWQAVCQYIPVMVITCIGLSVVSLPAAFRQRARSTISFNNERILISHRMASGTLLSREIPWWKLKSIRTENKRGLLLERQDVVTLEDTDGKAIAIGMSDLMASVSIGAFTNAARLLAPNAVTALKLSDDSSEQSVSYTKLWLQYFSTPSKRERLTELTDGLVLDGKYKVIGRIGGGGQGTAYLAVVDDDKGHSEVVLKEYVLPVHKGTAIMEQTLGKLKKETELLQRLDHPNIVKCLGYFVEDYRGYVILEYIDGESLKEIVAGSGPISEDKAVDIGMQCCDILEYLHKADPPIIHRDITPDNIMRQLSGDIKLVDFNVAHQLESSATATVVGKHCYLPPEQFRGKPVPASDIYALGGTLNYILTGSEPEPITASHPKTVQPGLSYAIDEIVAKATEPKLDRRYASAAEFRSQLKLLTPP